MPTGDITSRDYQITYVRPRPGTISKYSSRYPGHDLCYKKRKHRFNGSVRWQPYCMCRCWHGSWWPARNEASRRDYEYGHIQGLPRQGSLFGKGSEASPTVSDSNVSDPIRANHMGVSD